MRSKTTNKSSERFQRDISNTLTRLRKSREISQADLAKKSGVDRKTVNRIENNHFSPSMDTFFRICGALGVRPVEVMKKAARK